MSLSDTGSKEDRALLLPLGLVRETGVEDCSATVTGKMSKGVG